MGNIHINHSLDPDQQIFQYMGFHDLVDLLKFNQTFFMRANHPQRQGLQNTPGKWHQLSEIILPVRKGKKQPQPEHRPLHNLDADTITLQSWTLADTGTPDDAVLGTAIPWHDSGDQQPRVCIVSNIRALSQALFTDGATSVFIERAGQSGVACSVIAAAPSLHRQSKVLPGISPDSLCAIAISKRGDVQANLSPAGTHLRVDLATLLTGVIVPPNASERYMELITKLVQESVWITVTRASRPVAISNVSRLGSFPVESAATRVSKAAPVVALPRRAARPAAGL